MSDLTPQTTDSPTNLPPVDVTEAPELHGAAAPDIMSKVVAGKSQGQIVRARFLQHRGAMFAIVLLVGLVTMAFTSVGFLGWSGWWTHDPQTTNEVINGGRPTLSLFGANGVAIGTHPFGQDEVGRDVFARVMLGTQTSLIVMVIVGLVSGFLGVVIGALAGYFGGRLDRFLMSLTDLVITIPVIVLGAVLGALAAGHGGAWLLAVFLGIASWTTLARLVRGEILSLREREFVDAARVAGVSDFWIVLRHILPNCIGVIIVNQTLLMSSAILLETSLSFVGFGIRFPDVSLGQLINQYQEAFTTRPWLFWWPGVMIVLIALSVNFIGDGLRDAFDPRQKKTPARRAMEKAAPAVVVDAEVSTHEAVVDTRVAPLLDVRELTVEFFVEGEWFVAANKVSYDVRPGEVLAIVGESGSGKTQSSLAILGLLPPNGRASGSAVLAGEDLIGMTPSELQRKRGKDLAMIFQEPMTALNPVLTIGFQIMEAVRVHEEVGPAQARVRALELLRMVEMPEPEKRLDYYPHQLSGGQRQRAMIAQSLACDPGLLVADEPTTALDVTVQAEILSLMRSLRDRTNAGIVVITHDMGVVADLADNIIVMRHGNIVERGAIAEVLSDPQDAYTKQLLAAIPHLGTTTSADSPLAAIPTELPTAVGGRTLAMTSVGHAQTPPVGDAPLVMAARGLVIEYPGTQGRPPFRAVKVVDLDVARGEVVGLVGESGSGKSTIGRAAVGLLPVADGELEICSVDMRRATREQLRPLRRSVGMIFQDPGSSLNPRLPLGQSIGEPLKLHKGLNGSELSKAVEALLDQVELPRSVRNRYPHELSGGQRQRVGIARALSLAPDLLVADEPTSALDVSVQSKVLELFLGLQREYGFACLFISHDLAVVEQMCDRIAVLQHGEMVEVGTTEQVIWNPREPYTQRLIAAVPVPDPHQQAKRREERERLLAAAG
ncbi:MAG: dipeptide ABC transporter ATP-binding protein [Candidatus Nanopelagicales bacterium]